MDGVFPDPKPNSDPVIKDTDHVIKYNHHLPNNNHLLLGVVARWQSARGLS